MEPGYRAAEALYYPQPVVGPKALEQGQVLSLWWP